MTKRILILCTMALALVACHSNTAKQAKGLDAKDFEGNIDGQTVSLYTLKAGDITMQVTNFGGRIVSLFAPDKDGNYEDIVVGHKTLDEYAKPDGERFLGACVGPVANRIAHAQFVLDDTTYTLTANDHGNTLHGGAKGLDMVVWTVKEVTDSTLTLTYLRPDGQDGFPGNLNIEMKYSIDHANEVVIVYKATTDKATPVNISNHPFFCLEGEGNGTIHKYIMQINADKYTPIDSLSIPTGEIADVAKTPFDFREPHPIGQFIDVDDPQIRNGHGYDHNWCINQLAPGLITKACTVFDPDNGRCIEVDTDQPGLQFYSGNFFDGTHMGKYGRPLKYRSSFVLEAQHYPDTPNQPTFPSITLNPGQTYSQVTIYKVTVKK